MKNIKVITVSERIHKRLRRYCQERGLKVGACADEMISYALDVMPSSMTFKSRSYFMGSRSDENKR